MHLYAAISLILMLNCGSVTGQVDLTLEPNTTGCEVVNAVIEKINQLAKFQKKHKFLLNRIAYMYEFGEGDLPPDGIGMWGVTMENFNRARTSGWNANWPRYLGFDFSALQDEDIFKPYYNALTAFLLIQGQNNDVPDRSKVEEQYEFWVALTGINFNSGKYNESYFVEKSSSLNNEQCMECNQPPSDVVIVFDDSTSIQQSGFEQQMGFIRTLVSHLSDTLTTGETQLALVVFSTTVVFTSAYTTSESDFLAILDSRTHNGGLTNLVQGLYSAAGIVRSDSNSRKDDKLVRKIVFFLTDGGGNQEVELYPHATDTLKSIKDIVVFSIGMTSGANYSELLKAATSEDYVLQYSSFTEFTNEVDDILYQTCQITPTPVNIGGVAGYLIDITGLLMDDKRVVQMTFPDDQVLIMEMSTLATGDSVIEIIYNCDGTTPNKASYFDTFPLPLTQNQSSIQFALRCAVQQRARNGGVNKRSVDGIEGINGTNATSAPGNITASVAFIFVNTSENCQVCSIDLALNITQMDVDTWLSLQPVPPVEPIPGVLEDFVQDIIPEDEEDWLLLVLIVLLSVAICGVVVSGLWCMVKKCVEIKDNQTVGVYNEHKDAYKTNEVSSNQSREQKWSEFYNNPMYSLEKSLNSTDSNGDLKKGFKENVEEFSVPVFKITDGQSRQW